MKLLVIIFIAFCTLAYARLVPTTLLTREIIRRTPLADSLANLVVCARDPEIVPILQYLTTDEFLLAVASLDLDVGAMLPLAGSVNQFKQILAEPDPTADTCGGYKMVINRMELYMSFEEQIDQHRKLAEEIPIFKEHMRTVAEMWTKCKTKFQSAIFIKVGERLINFGIDVDRFVALAERLVEGY